MKPSRSGLSGEGHRVSRRRFLRTSSRALAGSAILGSGAAVLRAASSRRKANERLGVALIGCGLRGNALLEECLPLRATANLEFPAICDVWKPALEGTASRVEAATGRRPRTFTRYQELLQLPEVDCIVIASPDFTHAFMTRDAARAKRHVYVEKPMATRIEEANAATDAVLEAGIVCQVGTQFRSVSNFVGAAEFVRAGGLGRLVKVECSYNRNQPSWVREYGDVRREDVDWEQFLTGLKPQPFDPRKFRCWQLYRECTTGLVGLLGVHVIDVACWFADDPLPLSGVGLERHVVWRDREHADSQECLYAYPKGFLMHFESRLGNGNPSPEINFYGTRGTLKCPFSPSAVFEATGEGGNDERLEGPIRLASNEVGGHMADWFRCIREGSIATRADVHAGYAHSVASILAAEVCRTGRRLSFDAEKRTFREG